MASSRIPLPTNRQVSPEFKAPPFGCGGSGDPPRYHPGREDPNGRIQTPSADYGGALGGTYVIKRRKDSSGSPGGSSHTGGPDLAATAAAAAAAAASSPPGNGGGLSRIPMAVGLLTSPVGSTLATGMPAGRGARTSPEKCLPVSRGQLSALPIRTEPETTMATSPSRIPIASDYLNHRSYPAGSPGVTNNNNNNHLQSSPTSSSGSPTGSGLMRASPPRKLSSPPSQLSPSSSALPVALNLRAKSSGDLLPGGASSKLAVAKLSGSAFGLEASAVRTVMTSNDSRSDLHQDQPERSSSPSAPGPVGKARSGTPASPSSAIPTLGWSLQTEKQEQRSGRSPGGLTAETGPGDDDEVRYPAPEDRRKAATAAAGKKQFEAFMMTGDRIINLAKTPANNDFRSRFYKPALGPPIPLSEDLLEVSEEQEVHNGDAVFYAKVDENHWQGGASERGNGAGDVDEAVKNRQSAVKVSTDPAVRTSKSEDQLTSSSSFNGHDDDGGENGNFGDDDDVVNVNEATSGSLTNMLDSSTSRGGGHLLGGGGQGHRRVDRKVDGDENLGIDNDGKRVIITIAGNNLNSSSSGGSGGDRRGAVRNRDAADLDNLSGNLRKPPAVPVNDDDDDYDDGSNGNGSDLDLDSLGSIHHHNLPVVKEVDVPSAVRLAKRLFQLDGFKKTDVSRHLSRNNDFNRAVAEEYLKFFDFSGLTLDGALRRFLGQFFLTGETQERERVLFHFSRRYVECNPPVLLDDSGSGGDWAGFRSLDSVHTLTCAIMLLNTDLHGSGVGGGQAGGSAMFLRHYHQHQRRMTCNEFIENLSELNNGSDFPRDLLKNIYYAIKQEQIPWVSTATAGAAGGPLEGVDVPVAAAAAAGPAPGFHQGPRAVQTPSAAAGVPLGSRPEMQQPGVEAAPPALKFAIGKAGGGINPFLAAPDPATATDFKKGYVMRKCCFEPNGKRTKVGKRSWKMYYLVLRDMVLYCLKDDKASSGSGGGAGGIFDLGSAIRVHHGLAERAADYAKKQNVFRLHTSDQAQYLFQTADEKELLTWIDAINYAVAAFSAPQLPAPCSSDLGRFQRPLMPSAKTTLSPPEQLEHLEHQLFQLRGQLEDHVRGGQPAASRGGGRSAGALMQVYRDKERFLTSEVNRYETYVLTLRTRSGSGGTSNEDGNGLVGADRYHPQLHQRHSPPHPLAPSPHLQPHVPPFDSSRLL